MLLSSEYPQMITHILCYYRFYQIILINILTKMNLKRNYEVYQKQPLCHRIPNSLSQNHKKYKLTTQKSQNSQFYTNSPHKQNRKSTSKSKPHRNLINYYEEQNSLHSDSYLNLQNQNQFLKQELIEKRKQIKKVYLFYENIQKEYQQKLEKKSQFIDKLRRTHSVEKHQYQSDLKKMIKRKEEYKSQFLKLKMQMDQLQYQKQEKLQKQVQELILKNQKLVLEVQDLRTRLLKQNRSNQQLKELLKTQEAKCNQKEVLFGNCIASVFKSLNTIFKSIPFDQNNTNSVKIQKCLNQIQKQTRLSLTNSTLLILQSELMSLVSAISFKEFQEMRDRIPKYQQIIDILTQSLKESQQQIFQLEKERKQTFQKLVQAAN